MRQEFHQGWPEDRIGRVLAGRNANGARGFFPKLAQGGELGLDLLEVRTDGLEQSFTRLGARDAACGTGQQSKAKSRLEPANGVAQRRLRNPKLRRRLGEAPLSRDG